ncbi:MAG: PSD1 and planctomycete cytochrome C domain-containing protein [Pirellulales bacterium]
MKTTVLGWCSGLLLAVTAQGADEIQFARDVLPILAEHCLACHGPDEQHRKGDLRLDTQAGALRVIDRDAPAQSELVQRILATDPEVIMPPPDHRKPLSPVQQQTLKKWVEGGAAWGQHWAFVKPQLPPIPTLSATSAPLTDQPIDRLVQARLERVGRTLAPPASFLTLLRRVSLDLTGLPPTVDEVAACCADAGVDEDGRLADDPASQERAYRAYQRWVERLLASPHCGERLAMWWLDAARYSDTDGFQGDATRTNWPWRDWVIEAFNQNRPFDQFTIEQFAGDLLPQATNEQRLATCFHRNHMTNGEGGRDPEESRVDYVIDRVSTVGTVWLGLTLGCCQCHSHKYDPISQREFYSLAAFFNSIDEDGKAGTAARPYLSYESPRAPPAVAEARRLVDQRIPREQAARAAAEGPFQQWLQARLAELSPDFRSWHPLRSTQLESVEGTQLTQEADGCVQASGPHPRQDDYRFSAAVTLPRVTGLKLEVLPHPSHTRGGLSRGASGEFILTDIKVQVRRAGSSQVRDLLVAQAVADVSAEQKEARNYGDIKGVLDDDPRNGWTTQGHPATQPHVAVFQLAEPLHLEPDEQLVVELRQRSTVGDANIGRFRLFVTDQAGRTVQSVGPSPLEELAEVKHQGQEIPPPLREALQAQFLADYAPYLAERQALERAERQWREVSAGARKINVMVLAERAEPRPTHVLVRGVWDKPGEAVQRDVPVAIAPWPFPEVTADTRTREHLARWLMSSDNPLTARVIVNHLWQLLFGVGLVRTTEDFGVQGERPTHPELLDWLAVDFQTHGWDGKRLLRQIVLSNTYRQDSTVSPDLLVHDPENRLLARGARFRLPSWMLRDAALHSAGLLQPAIGGPPVRPYQPPGVWEEMFMGRFQYEPSEGPAQFRRTVYAFWRRAIAPTFLFDAAQRRTCEVRPARTNTPLHALTLLNDANFLVAARALGAAARQTSADPAAQIDEIHRRVLARRPTTRERTILLREYERARSHFTAHPADALRLFQEIPQPAADLPPAPPSELAAGTLVASLILNLDEALHHE